MSVYQVTHKTIYRYEEKVTASYGQTHLLPRESNYQSPQESSLSIWPVPDDRRTRSDFYGNRCVSFAILTEHTQLSVEATSLVEVLDSGAHPLAATMPWETARDLTERGTDREGLHAREMRLPSPRISVGELPSGYAELSFQPGRPLLDVALDLSTRIHRDFEYKPGSTDVATTVDAALDAREGVCQDFAHVAIACLRSRGLAARYVSGYLETDPPPGSPKLQGADNSHAWFDLHVPGEGWVGIDPTNDILTAERHVTTAWGRDYGDVPPVEGIIFTDGTSHDLEVQVDVIRVASNPNQ